MEINKTKLIYRSSEHGKMMSQKDSRNRRVKIKGIVHDFAIEEWQEKLQKTKGICPRCAEYVGINKLALDHIIPISKVNRGQRYSITMVQPLCKTCNSSKYNRFGKEELMQMFMELTDGDEDQTIRILKEVHRFLLDIDKIDSEHF